MVDKTKNYSVAVVATMSAGKSTLLNAIIGTAMLPSKNEACTATVFRIEDVDVMASFEAAYINEQGHSDWLPLTRNLLAEWNNGNFQEIGIRGNLPRIKNTENSFRVVFYDTPGTNNSTDSTHEKMTKKIICRADYCNLICVLNATVMAVEDERKLLSFIQKEIMENGNKTRPIFVINKIDEWDIDKGEDPKSLVESAKKYLGELGFSNPLIIPACSTLSLEIRTTIHSAQRMAVKEVAGDYRGVAKLKSLFSHRYKATSPSRKQDKIRTMLDSFITLKEYYYSALELSSEVEKALSVLQEGVLSTPRRKIKIGGKYFTYADLYLVDQLSGVAPLEHILEQELNAFAKKQQQKE